MRNKSILLKGIVCALIYMVFSMLLIFAVYILDLFGAAILLGLLCGIVIAVISYCDKIKRTITAMLVGILSAFAAQVFLIILGIPYKIILYIYRNDAWVKEAGRLSVNEVIGYNWGSAFFWFGLMVSFVITIVGILIFSAIKHC